VLGGRLTLGSGPGARLRVLLPCRAGGPAERSGRRDVDAAAGRSPPLRLVRGATALARAPLSS